MPPPRSRSHVLVVTRPGRRIDARAVTRAAAQLGHPWASCEVVPGKTAGLSRGEGLCASPSEGTQYRLTVFIDTVPRGAPWAEPVNGPCIVNSSR